MLRTATILIIILIIIQSNASAYALTTSWTVMEAEISPSARRSHAMVYVPDDRVVALFGGYGNGSHLGDTWIFDTRTNTWQEMRPSVAPSPRAATTLVYDPDQQQIILFGGFVYGHSIVSNETWSYDYATNLWTNLDPKNAPSERASYGMAYNPTRHNIVLFGGFTESGYFNDAWVYSPRDNTWEEISITGNVPSPRGAMGFVYDSTNDVFIMFGGFSERGFFNDTWIFDPKTNSWTLVEAADPPPPIRTRMIFDDLSGKAVFFGGDVIPQESEGTSPKPYSKAWSYDSTTKKWEELFTPDSPPARALNGIAYDSAEKAIIIFGGTDTLIDEANFVGHEFQDMWKLNVDELDTASMSVDPATLIFPIGVAVALATAGVGIYLIILRKNF